MNKKIIIIIVSIILVLAITTLITTLTDKQMTKNTSSELQSDASISDNLQFSKYEISASYAIIIDEVTGVCYLESKQPTTGDRALTPLLNANGSPRLWSQIEKGE